MMRFNVCMPFVVSLAMLYLGGFAQADVFNMGSGYTSLETVTVGDPGNTADTRYGVHGAVSYTYEIGKYEVTTAQYVDFLNHKAQTDDYGLYSPSMAGICGCGITRGGTSGNYRYSVTSDRANRPVTDVSFLSACRFANWLSNGQGDGDTENGTYTLNGRSDDGECVQRNAGAKWAVTNEDEWYKAAYYKGGGLDAGYWKFATQSDWIPSKNLTNPDGGNNANYYGIREGGYTIGLPYYFTNVGDFENSESAYGTFDQCGNVWEWTESIDLYYQNYFRLCRGGSALALSEDIWAGSWWYGISRSGDWDIGFRVSLVPEPSSAIVLLVGLIPVARMKIRRR